MVGAVVVAIFFHIRMAIRVVLGEVVVIGMDKEVQLPGRILQHLLGIRAESPPHIVTMVAEGLVVVVQVESEKASVTTVDEVEMGKILVSHLIR